MTAENVVWIVGFTLMVLLTLLILYYYLSRNVLNPAGKGAAKKTRGVLIRYAVPRSFRVLSNLRFEAKDGVVVAENLLIGFFGILLVRTCGARGEYYGRADSAEWVLVQEKGSRKSVPNPVRENERAMREIRLALAKNKIHNVRLSQIVLFSDKSKKTQVFINHEDQLILSNKLKSCLGRAKFDEDEGADVEKIAGILEPYIGGALSS